MTYTTFFVSRHPLERLVSAYESKFRSRNGAPPKLAELGKTIALKQAKHYLLELNYKTNKYDVIGDDYVIIVL